MSSKSKRFRISQQDAASPVKASVTETLVDEQGNETEITRDLSGTEGDNNSSAAPSASGEAGADASQQDGATTTTVVASNPSGVNGPEGTNSAASGSQDGSTSTIGASDPTSAAAAAGNNTSAAASDVHLGDTSDAQHQAGTAAAAGPITLSTDTPESGLTGGAGNSASPAQDTGDKRRFFVLAPVRLDNVRYAIGKVVTIDRDQHRQLARNGVVDQDWDEDAIGPQL